MKVYKLIFALIAAIPLLGNSMISDQSMGKYAKEEAALHDILNSLGESENLEKMLEQGLVSYKNKWQTAENGKEMANYEMALRSFSKAILGIKDNAGNLLDLIKAEKAIEDADNAVSESNPAKKKLEENIKQEIEEAQASLA